MIFDLLILFISFLAGFLIGESQGYCRGVKDEARRKKDEQDFRDMTSTP